MTLLKKRLDEVNVRLKGNVIDIGIRDGRNLALIKELGAETIYGCDPSNKEFGEAIKTGLIKPEHLIHAPLEGLEPRFDGFFDWALIFQINPPLLSNDGSFFRTVKDILKPDGMLIYTVSENELVGNFDSIFYQLGFRFLHSIALSGFEMGNTPYQVRKNLERHEIECRCWDAFGEKCSIKKYLDKEYTAPNQNIRVGKIEK